MSTSQSDRRVFLRNSAAAMAAGGVGAAAFGRAGPSSKVSGPPCSSAMPVVNVKDYGAQGDGSTDDTVAIQDAIDSMPGCLEGYCLFFPPGVYLISATLQFGGYSGLLVQGSGSLVDSLPGWYGLNLGSVLKWSAKAQSPMIDLYGTGSFAFRDIALDGNSVAGIGIRVRYQTYYAGVYGLFENVSIFQCNTAMNAGDNSATANCGDMSYIRCSFARCANGFSSSHQQAVNHAFHSCHMGFISGSCFDVCAPNLYVDMFECEACNRIVYVRNGGPNTGHITVRNLRIDAVAEKADRTIVHETDSKSDTSAASYEDVTIQNAQPNNTSDSRARFIITGGHTVTLRGGRNLCGNIGSGDSGRLVTMSGYSGFLCEGVWLPTSYTGVLGTIGANSKYRFRSNFDMSTLSFLTDAQN
jgi:hypothetical protein